MRGSRPAGTAVSAKRVITPNGHLALVVERNAILRFRRNGDFIRQAKRHVGHAGTIVSPDCGAADAEQLVLAMGHSEEVADHQPIVINLVGEKPADQRLSQTRTLLPATDIQWRRC